VVFKKLIKGTRKMEWVDVFIQYLSAYEQKDLERVSDMFVVDVLTLNENGKITAIHAYLGRDG